MNTPPPIFTQFYETRTHQKATNLMLVFIVLKYLFLSEFYYFHSMICPMNPIMPGLNILPARKRSKRKP